MSSSTPSGSDRWRWRIALDRARRRLMQRLLLIAGGLALLRLNAAVDGWLGFLPPVTPEAITIDFARVLAAVLGVWMLYRGLR